MQATQTTQDYLALATALAQEFSQTAVDRDLQAGTPQQERDRLRQSGLLQLIIPQRYGGIGESWMTTFKVARELAKVDSSIAHVLSYHYLGVVIPHIFGAPDQKDYYYAETVKQNWFWCNGLNPLDRRTTLTPAGDHYLLNGLKSFCSGSKDSDILPITAVHSETGKLQILAVPTTREGIYIHSDWENMGQRQTDSGSITFHHVLVYSNEIFGSRTHTNHPFNTIRACLTQLNLANIYLGITQGAFAAAKHYTQTQSRPWFTSGLESATADPYLLEQYGNLWVDLQAATCLTDLAAELLQLTWEKEWNLTAEERGNCAVAIATAKVAATRVGLHVANQMFELMGARSTHSKYGFDRYWRNLRTFTLHDPIVYKVKDLGNWALNDQYPSPSFYS